MKQPVVIRGYAAVFGQLSRGPVTFDDDRPGVIAPGAFNTMLECDQPVVLQWSHESNAPRFAYSDRGDLFLFQDDCGLGFEATIYPEEHPAIWSILPDIKNGYGASIDNTGCHMSDTIVSGVSCWLTEERTISHIAMVPDPNFGAACCWRADVPMNSNNDRIVNAAERWANGYAQHIRAKTRKPSTSLPNTTSPRHAAAQAFRAADATTMRMLREPQEQQPKKPSTLALMVTLQERFTRRLLALEKKVATLEKQND